MNTNKADDNYGFPNRPQQQEIASASVPIIGWDYSEAKVIVTRDADWFYVHAAIEVYIDCGGGVHFHTERRSESLSDKD